MKKTVIASIVAVTLFGVGLVVVAQQQQRNLAEQEAQEELDRLLERMGDRQPDTDSENWAQLTESVGMMIYTDRFGVRRARLYVRQHARWEPLAVDGLAELGPGTMPLG